MEELTRVSDLQVSWKKILVKGLPMLIIPVAILIIIILAKSFYFLEYFHVVSGSAWTGMDLVMGIFFGYIMAGLPPKQRTEVATRLTPVMLFFMPSITSTTVTAGLYLIHPLGISISNPYLIVVGIIVIAMFVQGLGIFLPNELRVYLEIVHGAKNVEKIVRLTMINLRLSLIQLILQIVLILFMAHFATGVPL
jgi:hypothetical protein